jgi:integrase
MLKSNDGITIYFVKYKSGTYIYLRATVEINGLKKNRKVATGELKTEENLKKYKKEARPTFLEKLGLVHHKTLLFEDFYLEALEYVNIDANSETSQERISKVERYILPYFKGRDIKTIEASFVEEWQFELKKKGLNADLIRRCKRLITRIFNRAIVLGHRKYNPTDGTSKIRGSKKNVHEIYSKAEITEMVAGADGWMRVFILLFAILGLRSNEIIVLEWKNIDWINSTLYIESAIRRGEFRDPKTGKRLVEIPKSLLSVLEEFKSFAKTKWLFPNKKGSYYHDSSAINTRYFQPLLKKLNIPYKGMYELKHTGVSLQIGEGLDPNYVCEQIGHKDVATTFKYYSKLIKNDENIKKVDEILNFRQ